MIIEDDFKIDGTYELVDGVYNVDGNVRLIRECEKLPFKFGKVSGDFSCSNNNLKTLKGAPKSVGGYFYCFGNNLNSLEGCPKYVDGCFFCFGNNLNSLEGCPKSVDGYFFCDENLYNTKEYKQYLIMRKLRE